MSSRAFTLLEVLLSVVLLFTMGLALLRLDGWIKTDVARYRDKSMLLYQQTPLLYAPLYRIRKTETSLYDVLSFTKLRDDEIFWLKSLEGGVELGKEEKRTLFQSGEMDLTYRYVPIRLFKGETSVGFVRIKP